MNKPRRTTSKQVAERAGVSQTTVSFVLNNVEDANISTETKERVLQAARDLNYVPDRAARSLARGRSNNIALVLSQPHAQIWIDEYIPKILTGISQATEDTDWRILVQFDRTGTRDVYTDLLQSKEAAGVIVNFSHPSSDDIRQILACTQQGLAIVSLSNIHPDVYSVEVDKFAGVQKVVRHLISQGHHRIACISYAPAKTNPHADRRLRIFRDTLREAGCAYDPKLVRHGAFEPDTGYEAMRSILQESPHPTALYAMNDVMAFGAYQAIYEAGLRIPEDIAVVGFDNIRLANYVAPPLTTINEPDVEQGRRAAEMLLALIDSRQPEEKHVTLETQLVVRRSCGARQRSESPEKGGYSF
ncbi:MAG: LacI family transcriptional regulator [Anaerolineae bacterium]|nr:LacI family transcriptional regulator [Anaerolineae bacterium]NUQ06537.1 LacI family DNA-binding transcriptional regulator [Anaerolineae bacterium]